MACATTGGNAGLAVAAYFFFLRHSNSVIRQHAHMLTSALNQLTIGVLLGFHFAYTNAAKYKTMPVISFPLACYA